MPASITAKWFVEHPFKEQGVFVSDAETTALVARIWGDSPKEIEDRAKLIAAAPVMLATLQEIINAFDAPHRGTLAQSIVRAREIIKEQTT